jgi:hypothetical protein
VNDLPNKKVADMLIVAAAAAENRRRRQDRHDRQRMGAAKATRGEAAD